MFTGLVQDVGTIAAIERERDAVHFLVRTTLAAELREGDSLATNGVCLTVTRLEARGVRVTAVHETLTRTTLGDLKVGARANLEPALRAGDRLGGHIVQGHVDGTGRVARIERRGAGLELTVAMAAPLRRYVVEKGSITIDGVSLTVAALTGEGFTVALIPHTLGATTLESRRAGDRVNLEVDILAKYVERMLGRDAEPMAPAGEAKGITEEWLRQQGF